MNDQAQKIARLNDEFRQVAGWGSGGQVLMTAGIAAMSPEDQTGIFNLVRIFNTFTEEDDPYGEHDFGALDYKGQKVFWKIEYYAPDMQHGSEDPADPAQTVRVMTVMLANEY